MKTQTLIGLLSEYPSKASFEGGSARGINVTIASIDAESKTPRNFSFKSFDKNSLFGGFSANIYQLRGDFGCYHQGPSIRSDTAAEYLHAAKGLALLDKRLDAQRRVRGGTADVADQVSRWLEACDIETVFTRPNAGRDYQSLLSEGQWIQLDVGYTTNLLRSAILSWRDSRLAATA